MTVGRGGGTFRRTILILLVVGLVVAVLAGALLISGFPGGTDPSERGSGRGAAAESDVPADHDSPAGGDSPRGTETGGGTDDATSTAPDSADGTDPAADGPLEPLGSSLQGPRAARMQRWEPRFGVDGAAPTVSARSTVVDAVVRVVSLDSAEGRDAVAVRIARGQWDELAAGVASEVPRIVWESIARGTEETGELREVYAIEDTRPAEYILRFANEQVLLRLYGSSSSVDDAEVEALQRP